MDRVYLSGPWLYDNEGGRQVRPIETQDIHYSRRVKDLVQSAGVELDDADNHVREFASSMGMPIEEAVEHMIGALQYMAGTNPCNEIVLDSIGFTHPDWLGKEPREKVNWKKEGF